MNQEIFCSKHYEKGNKGEECCYCEFHKNDTIEKIAYDLETVVNCKGNLEYSYKFNLLFEGTDNISKTVYKSSSEDIIKYLRDRCALINGNWNDVIKMVKRN